jgi:iron complex transport system substrate-binding protein
VRIRRGPATVVGERTSLATAASWKARRAAIREPGHSRRRILRTGTVYPERADESMSRRVWSALLVSVGLLATMCACAAHPEDRSAAARDCISEFHPGTDYFPDKSTVHDATNFTVSHHDSYQVLTVKQPYPHGRPESYLLVRCGAPAPELNGDLARAQRITVPVASIYSASITQLGMISELGRMDVVTGGGDTADVVDPRLRRRIASGKAGC